MKTPPLTSAEDIEAAAADWIARRDAGLSAAEERVFTAWKNADRRHTAALANLELIWSALDKPRRSGAAREMLGRFADHSRRRRSRRERAGLAATILLLAAGLAWNSRPAADKDSTGAQPRVAVTLPEKLTLADGSVVELREDAVIAVEYTEAVRRVALQRGAAHFQVAKNPARPFVVVVSGIEVRAIGTAFSVELGAADVDVVVTEGKVGVSAAANNSAPAVLSPGAAPRAPGNGPDYGAREVSLGAAQHVAIPLRAESDTAPAIVTLDDHGLAARLAWRTARLDFTDTPLHEAVTLMNAHAAGPGRVVLAVADRAAGQILVTGIFRAENTEAFVRLIETSSGLTAERAGSTITLRQRR